MKGWGFQKIVHNLIVKIISSHYKLKTKKVAPRRQPNLALM